MGTEQTKVTPEQQAKANAQVAQNNDDDSKPTPKSAQTNGEKNGTNPRAGTVGTPVETSFDERTGVAQPFILENGLQDNGAIDLDLVDGAKGGATREGNNTVREDTRQAIKDGVLPASDQPKGTLKGEEPNDGKPLNPVK